MNLECINVYYSYPDRAWQVELHSYDGTTWTISRGLIDELEAIDKLKEFLAFSGLKLPAYCHGNPILLR